ncbi:hypothetical protein X798_00913 [Onchocerca flexuosa]|uniref:Uncharacterized protein n=1 Tax=Onchocerca flexuosa TaxID=387005 RepID=A0A238C2Q8_9BILA|nr:hypothetical protein X798_00913 [Onchocerca flexuosa]
MESTNDYCNNKENESSKYVNSSSNNGCALREASNVILLVSDSSETGKYILTLWYLEHINSTIALEASDKDENGIRVVKIIAQDGDEIHDDEQLLVTNNTLVSYVVQSYRFVFIIDISPSTFTVVILQGCLLTKKNIGSVLHHVQERFVLFSTRLCWTMQPHLRKWNQERKKLRQRAEDLLPENFFRQQAHATDGFRDSIHGPMTTQMTIRASPADEGFINSEWSLIFMLRTGLIGLQLLPDTAQPMCNVTDIHALQKLVFQLRNYSVACSFIQIQGDCNTNAVFGHFSSPEFFTFLAKGTSGVYIPDENQTTVDGILNPIDCRPLLCKNLQLLDATDDYIKDLIHQINPEFVEPYAFGVIRRMHYSMEYESCLEYFLRLRLYEGFILRNLKVLKKGEDQSLILVELSLPWKPQVTIGYKICALSEDCTKRTKLKITVICEAQYGMIRDLLSDRCSVNTAKQTFSDAYRHTIFGLLETDRMLIHVHSFNSLPDLFRLSPEILKEKSLFRYVMKENKAILTISTRELETLCSQNVAAANFVEFWRIISESEERYWQSWSQVYTFRVILTHDHPLPPRLFLAEEPNVKVTSQLALTVFYNILTQMTTFSLIHGQTYVKFVEGNDGDDIPKAFYIVKLNLETQLIVIKFAFLNGLTMAFRNKVMREYREILSSLSVERSCFFIKMLEFADVGDDCVTTSEAMHLPALTIVNCPLEIMLARYKKIPLVLDRIIRLEKTDEANRNLILHNSLAKYFSCKRFIWYLKKAFPLSSVVSCTYADFILHIILQRRLNEGFHIVYGDSGIINLVKHVHGMEQELYSGSALLQYIIFPPTAIRPLRIVKEHLEKGSTLSKTIRMREVEMKKSAPDGNSTLESDFDLQLMTEMWSEPFAIIDPQCIIRTGTIQQQVSVSSNFFSNVLNT